MYGQRDPQWKDIKLGSSGVNIGNFGCAITSICNLLELAGITVTPPQLNEWLLNNKGYSKGNLVVWSAIDRFTNQKVMFEKFSLSADRFPCIAEVDMLPKTTAHDQHFVLALDEHMCFDPWDGKKKLISEYGGAKSYRIYKLPPQEDTVELERLRKEADDARKARDKHYLDWEQEKRLHQETKDRLTKVEREVSDLIGLVDRKNEEIKQLKIDLESKPKEVVVESPRFNLTSTDYKAIGRGAIVALVGALIVFLTDNVPAIDFGQWTPFVAAIAAVAVNALRKWVAEQK